MFSRFGVERMFNSDAPVVIDKEDLLKAYLDCPHLRAVIDKRGEFFANGAWKCVSTEDEKKEFPNDPGLKLLRKPNAFQSGEDFMKDYLFYKDLYANTFIYENKGSALALPVALWNLPSEWMQIILSRKFFDQVDISQIIKEYRLCNSGYERVYDTSEIIYKPERFSISKGKGTSKVPSLQLPISNIVAALKTRNILIVNKGMIGFLSTENKDAVGSLPFKGGQRKEIEEQFEDDANLFSSRPKIKIVGTPSRWNPMSYPTKDLALFEEIEDDFNVICDAYGVMRDVFSSTKGATFQNQKEAKKGTYTDTIQPEADAFAEMMTTALNPGPGKKYILDYSWLPIMQADKKSEEESERIKGQRLSLLYADNIISAEAYAEQAGTEMTGTGLPPKQGITVNAPTQ